MLFEYIKDTTAIFSKIFETVFTIPISMLSTQLLSILIGSYRKSN